MVYNTPTFNKDLMNPSHPVVKKDSKPMPAYDFHLKKKGNNQIPFRNTHKCKHPYP